MSRFTEVLRVGAAELIALAGPTVVFGVAGAIGGGVLALGIALLVGRLVARARRGSVRVASLAARGATRAEIARRTGISQDAVGMVLHSRSGPRGRRNLPAPARIAASQRRDARRRNRGAPLQVVAAAQDRHGSSAGAEAARPLPFAGLTARRLTRSGRAA